MNAESYYRIIEAASMRRKTALRERGGERRRAALSIKSQNNGMLRSQAYHCCVHVISEANLSGPGLANVLA